MLVGKPEPGDVVVERRAMALADGQISFFD
jgi:hypothetical protein